VARPREQSDALQLRLFTQQQSARRRGGARHAEAGARRQLHCPACGGQDRPGPGPDPRRPSLRGHDRRGRRAPGLGGRWLGSRMSDVFISYARETAAKAALVAEGLRALGYSVWRDDELPAHRDYAQVIEERLRAAKAVVVVWSTQ